MSLRDDLIAAKVLIEDPDKWVKHPGQIEISWCAITACAAVTDYEKRPGASEMWDALEAELPPGWQSVGMFNDHPDTTHADIMALFDRAIAKAGGADA